MNLKISLLFLLFIIFTGCSSSSSSSSSKEESNETVDTKQILDDSISLKGIISNELVNSSPAIKKSYANIGDISQIIAFPIENGSVINVNNQQSTTVASDGSFQFSFSQKVNQIMMMVNESAVDLEDKFKGFVAVNEDKNIQLCNFPIQNATSNIDVGTLSITNNKTTSSNTISDISTSFDLDLSTLIGLTGLGNLEKMNQNRYLASLTEWDSPYLQYTLNIQNDTGANTYSNVSSFTNHQPFSYINTNQFTKTEFDSLKDTLKLTSPDNINIDYNVHYTESSNNTMLSFSYTENIIPSGYFKIKHNNVTSTIFDLSLGNLQDNDGNFKTILPSVKIDVDSNDKLTGFTLNWYKYNLSTSSYEKITDLTVLEDIANKSNAYTAATAFNSEGDEIFFSQDKFNFDNSIDFKATFNYEKDILYTRSSRSADTYSFQHLSVHFHFGDVMISYQISYNTD